LIRPLPLWWLPLLAGVLTLVTIHASYLIAAAHGHVPWCVPYIDSCTSISATGRQWPERAVFKPLMTMSALLVAATFWLGARWLQVSGDVSARAHRWLPRIALLMALCIVVYVAALGEAGGTAKVLRKAGVTLGFGLAFLGEILLLSRIAALQRAGVQPVKAGTFRALRGLVAVTLGMLSVFLSAFHAGYARMDDAFEWVFALLLNVYLIVLAVAWRASGFVLTPGMQRP
jgi:hypothetical protein